MKKSCVLVAVGSCLVLFAVVNNCRLRPRNDGAVPKLLAHRGLAQTFDIQKVEWRTNTAAIIYPPEHPYVENTIPSMRAAFDHGADIVELDIRVTKDKRLAVFHDFDVGSRTERTGPVSGFTLAELKQLDVGYGYTHDGGKTYPLRGTGIGLLPSFDEVMEAFPDRRFLVHIRDEGEEIGRILLARLKAMDQAQTDNISIYCNDAAIEIIRKDYPHMKAVSLRIIKKALLQYELVGWTGYVPQSMRNVELHLPLEVARFLWGWPHVFMERMDRANTRMVLVRRAGRWSAGFDTAEDIAALPSGYAGHLWTERIDRMGRLYGRGRMDAPGPVPAPETTPSAR
jgi:glycerophosphoryl diester phosphodiesterase